MPTLSPGGKPAIQSLTLWGAGISLAASAAGLVGYTVTADDQQQIVNLINQGYGVFLTITGIISSGLAIYGRIRAQHQITSAVSAKS